jgi:hypothetical protein
MKQANFSPAIFLNLLSFPPAKTSDLNDLKNII